MVAWLTRDEESQDIEPDEALDDLYEPELAWAVFKFIENTQGEAWQWLPMGGGLLDQPESLWHDLMVLERAKGVVKDMLKPSVKPPAGED